MSNNPSELRYVDTHEWIRLEDGLAVVGITDHAQDLLGDVVFVELPEVYADVSTGEEIAVVESVKAASDIYAPLTGTIVEVNEALADAPESVNSDPYGDGWMFKMKLSDESELENTLSADEYADICDDE